MCVPVSVDVKRHWADVRQGFSGVEESILIDRLRDTVMTKARHVAKMSEAAA